MEVHHTESSAKSWHAPILTLPKSHNHCDEVLVEGCGMTVLVTGGAGYIGSHTVLELLDAGEGPPVVLDDLSTGFRWSVPEGTPLVVGDFGDADLVADLIERHGVDEIIHFAAKIVVPDSVADPLGYYLNNTAKARTLLATAVARRVKRFIFFDRRRLRRPAAKSGQRGRAVEAGFALWAIEAHGRVDAGGYGARARPCLCRPALFQCRRRGSEGAFGAIDARGHASHQGRRADGARPAPETAGLRRRLPDAGRQVRAGLYPGHRSLARPSRRSCVIFATAAPISPQIAAMSAAFPFSK